MPREQFNYLLLKTSLVVCIVMVLCNDMVLGNMLVLGNNTVLVNGMVLGNCWYVAQLWQVCLYGSSCYFGSFLHSTKLQLRNYSYICINKNLTKKIWWYQQASIVRFWAFYGHLLFLNTIIPALVR